MTHAGQILEAVLYALWISIATAFRMKPTIIFIFTPRLQFLSNATLN